MKTSQNQATAFRWLQEIMIFVVFLTFAAYYFGTLSQMMTLLFWMIEVVIYFAVDFLVEILFEKYK